MPCATWWSRLGKVAVPDGIRLACDVGAVRIGIAVCDRGGLIASPRDPVPAGPHAPAQVAAHAAEIGAIEIIVGMPINLDGSRGASAEAVDRWVDQLREHTRIPITIVDERLSTVQAQRRLHEGGKNARQSRHLIDSMAAAILLEAHLHQLDGGGGT
jgi:putative Holliday junction resolvase